MASQRIFVSSMMDGELNPYREAIRDYLQQYGTGVPVMWETISPADLRPDDAYLSGVDASSLFLLMLGDRYGVAGTHGFSPTHQEANRARDRHLPRLLFTLPPGSTAPDGRLQDWLRSLYNEISGNRVSSPQNLVAQLKGKLEDLAAQSEREWIKLGRCIFIGRVTTVSNPNSGQSFRILAKARNLAVRREILAMGNSMHRGELTLTSRSGSFPVRIDRVEETTEFAGDSDFEIACRTPQNGGAGQGSGLWNMTVNNIGPEELARQWAEHAMFGTALPADRSMGGLGFYGIRPDGPTLPQVLDATRAKGWQAVGIIRLYAVEELARTRGGQFVHLNVGPGTAKGVMFDGTFELPGMGQRPSQVELHGVVPLT